MWMVSDTSSNSHVCFTRGNNTRIWIERVETNNTRTRSDSELRIVTCSVAAVAVDEVISVIVALRTLYIFKT